MPSHDAPIAPSLETQARAVLADLRTALSRLMGGIGVPIRHPRHLRDALGLHQTLAWKMLRVVQTTDLLSDAQYIPGPAGFETFLRAATERGVDAALISEARTAFGRFRAMIDAQAGDRPSLEMMLNGLSEAEDSAASDSRAARKAGFRCASSTWGVQIRTRLLSQIIAPSEEPGMLDFAIIRGSIGMRRIRPGAVLPIGPMMLLDDETQLPVPSVRPLDPESATGGMGLLKDFCSQPLPRIVVGKSPRGTPEHQLGEAPVGGKEGMTVYFGEVHRAVAPRHREGKNDCSNTALTTRLPIETAVIDVWAHRGTFENMKARGLLYGELSGVPWYEQVEGHKEQLVLAERVEALGPGLHNAALIDVPEYRDIMAMAFDRLGCEADGFTLHRLRVEYPVIATALVVQLDMPEKRG